MHLMGLSLTLSAYRTQLGCCQRGHKGTRIGGAKSSQLPFYCADLCSLWLTSFSPELRWELAALGLVVQEKACTATSHSFRCSLRSLSPKLGKPW